MENRTAAERRWREVLTSGALGFALGCFTWSLRSLRRKPSQSKQAEHVEVSDRISQLEDSFPFEDLLSLDYFKKYRSAYYDLRDHGWQIPVRNYCTLLEYLSDIFAFRRDDASTFAKMFRDCSNDWHNGEATFAEVIVYRYYVRLAYEGIITDVRCGRRECDVIVERLDGSRAYLEVFSITPERTVSVPPHFVVNELKTHKQDEKASVRQKLLRKIKEQGQMTQQRDNFAVVELNDPSIAGSFTLLSSLSGGYKIHVNCNTGEQTKAGYDWSQSVFADEATRHLKGVIWFGLGGYEDRRFLSNPFFDAAATRHVPPR